MKRILPFLPLFTLIIGIIAVQGSQYNTGAILSSVLTGEKSPEITKICTKPEAFSGENESAWCRVGFVTDVFENETGASWTCVVDNKRLPCNFSKTETYRLPKMVR